MSDLTVDVSERDHRRGPESAPAVLVAYCDFECPDCAENFNTVKQLLLAYGDKLLYVCRNFPLTDIHSLALWGARFAEAADKQGQFWQFHDFVYENQHLLQHPNRLLEGVSSLGLDIEWMKRDVADRVFDAKIQEDIKGGRDSGVAGTPSLFLNGRSCRARADALGLNRLIAEAIHSAQH